jgi:hypothetical protein
METSSSETRRQNAELRVQLEALQKQQQQAATTRTGCFRDKTFEQPATSSAIRQHNAELLSQIAALQMQPTESQASGNRVKNMVQPAASSSSAIRRQNAELQAQVEALQRQQVSGHRVVDFNTVQTSVRSVTSSGRETCGGQRQGKSEDGWSVKREASKAWGGAEYINDSFKRLEVEERV